MTFAWGVIAGSVGLNALIKSNQQKSKLRKAVAPIQVNIDTGDIFKVGVVLTVVAAIIAIVAFISLGLSFLSRKASSASRIQGAVLAFLGTWLLACQIPYTVFFATRAANVTAKLGNISIGKDVIAQTEKALGVTSVYKNIDYLKLVAILPWFTILFTFISAAVLFTSPSDSSAATTASADSGEHVAAPRHSEAATNEKEAESPTTA